MKELQELRIGEKIRWLREQAGLLQADLAEQVGISEPTLSQIERGVVAPPIATLVKLARALGTEIAFFFAREEDNEEIEVVRRSQRRKARRELPQGKNPLSYSYESLSHRRKDKHMEPFLVEFEAESGEEIPLVDHEGEEFIFVLEGKIEFRSPRGSILLEEGDSLYFNSTIPHAFYGKGKIKPRALAVICARQTKGPS